MARRSATRFKAMKLPTRAETTNYQGQSLRDKVLQHRKRSWLRNGPDALRLCLPTSSISTPMAGPASRSAVGSPSL